MCKGKVLHEWGRDVPVSEIRRRIRNLRDEFGGGKPGGNRAARYAQDNGVREVKEKKERKPEGSGLSV